jgi:hypothetical protein
MMRVMGAISTGARADYSRAVDLAFGSTDRKHGRNECAKSLRALPSSRYSPRAAQTELDQAVDFTGQIQNPEFDFTAKNFLFPRLVEARARAAQG